MKRFWFGLGCTLALSGAALAQDSAPKARLGLPTGQGIIVRGAAPDDKDKVEPKPMPKAGVTEAPKMGMLTMPTDAGPSLGSIPGLPPGSYIVPPGTPLPPGAIVTGPNGAPIGSGPIVATPPGGPTFGGTPTVPAPPVPGGGLVPHVPGTINGDCSVTGGACIAPNACAPTHRWYTSAEFLMWYMRNFTAPPLVNVGPPGSIGAVGENGVQTIIGGSQFETNPRYGTRVNLGYWFSPKWAIEGSFFFLAPKGETFIASPAQYPNAVISRPFFSVNQNAEFAEQVANPGIYDGSVIVETKSLMWGAELNLRRNWWCGESTRFDGLLGASYLSLNEELSIAERTLGLRGAPQQFVGVERAVFDRFKVDNNFYGGQIGGILEHRWGRWSVTATAKVAIGFTRQYVDVYGSTTVLQGGAPPNQGGGLLALDSNSSTRAARDAFAVVPEGSLNIGYNITPQWKVFVGYNFLFWSDVVRPGSQIDRSLDEHRIPDFTTGRNVPTVTTTRPVPRLDTESLFLQGISFGLQFKW